jgi:hypothetical protein
MGNLLGPRPEAAWGPQERAVGRGFAGIPFANTGIQFGLSALRNGLITPQQFVDLNAKIGGLDVDRQRTDERVDGDPAAIANAYRTGLVNEMTNLDEVAIINHGGPDPGIAHDYAHAFWTEERLLADQGHTDNRVMWFGPTPLIGDPHWAGEALLAMDSWLGAVETDDSPAPLAEKIVAQRPADVTDRCVVAELAPACEVEDLQVLQTRLSTPRQEAGGPVANDNVACRLRPFSLDDYGPVAALFTPEQVATLSSLFADGVCDWSVPGRGTGPTETWLRYDGPDGGHAYGGRPLRGVPPESGDGWFSPAFRSVWQR